MDACNFISSFNFLTVKCWNGPINLIDLKKNFTAYCTELLTAKLAGLKQNKFTWEAKSPCGLKKKILASSALKTFSCFSYIKVTLSFQQPICAPRHCSALVPFLILGNMISGSSFPLSLQVLSSLSSCPYKAFQFSYSWQLEIFIALIFIVLLQLVVDIKCHDNSLKTWFKFQFFQGKPLWHGRTFLSKQFIFQYFQVFSF